MKSLLILAIVLASTSAFATRARLQSLGNAPHLVDSASVYNRNTDIFAIGDSLTIESGKTNLDPSGADVVAQGAEALIIRSAGDAKWAFSLGHDDAKIYSQRDEAGSTFGQQNPFEVTYGMKAGDLAWAATLGYSNYNDKAGLTVKDTTTNLKFGAATSTWDASVDLGLVNKTTSATTLTADNEFEGKGNIAVRGGYWVSSDLYAYGIVDMGGYEVTKGGVATAEVKSTDITVGVINTMKNDGNEFFYGVGLMSSTSKDSKAVAPAVEKSSELSLPVIIGMEANAASWLTLRGSVQQNVLIQNKKSESTAATLSETSPGVNSTTFAAGAGLKLGKLALDASLLKDATTGVDTQKINTTDLLGTVGLTYSF